MPNQWTDFGSQVAQEAAGGVLGLVLGGINDKRQLRQQQKLQDMQIQGNKEMGVFNKDLQLEMWNKTNYGPQMQQLAKAGLNPGLIYGMSGGGATTTGSPQGTVSGADAPRGGGEAIAMAQLNAQLGLMRAQKENIEADTQNKLTTKPNIEAGTQDILQGIQNKKAQQYLTEIQSQVEEVNLHIAGKTQQMQIAQINTVLRQATEQLEILTNEKQISNATKDEKIHLIEQQLIGTYLDNALTKAQTGKTQQDTEATKNEILRKWQELSNEQDRTKIQQQLADFNTSFGSQVGAILGDLLRLIPSKSTKTHTFKK